MFCPPIFQTSHNGKRSVCEWLASVWFVFEGFCDGAGLAEAVGREVLTQTGSGSSILYHGDEDATSVY